MTTTLLCLHGMACTGRVWDPFQAVWDGPVVAPDLAGHGDGPRLEKYGIAGYTAELKDRFGSLLADPADVVIVGHSMGGAVGLELARSITPKAVVAVGVKTVWPADEVAGMSSVADKGIRWFDAKDDAETWFLKVSGLFGLLDVGSDIAASGVVEEEQGWRLLTDPEAYRASGPPVIAEQLAEVQCPVRLGRGSEDSMVPAEQVEPYDSDYETLPGGHSVHVEQPEALAELVRTFL